MELKTVQEIPLVFEAQFITYVKLFQVPKELLINFNCSTIFHEGQQTFVNEYFINSLNN